MAMFRPLFRNPHLQTIAGHYWPQRIPRGEAFAVRRRFQTEPGVQVEALCEAPSSGAIGQIVMVHGLEGSADAPYMRRLGALALSAGFAVCRLNLRSCGGTERLSQTLYHAGLTSDLLAVLRELQTEGRGPAFLVGFSLGGNIVLKLAGELGAAARGWIRGVAGVSTPLDLEACCRRIAERGNRFYEWRFVRRMRARLRATGRYSRHDLAGLRSIRAIDERITAPAFGFGSAVEYYRTQSAIGFLHAIRVPALILQAKDDPFIPFQCFDTQAIRSNLWIELLVTTSGGHLGFLGRRPERFWADRAILDWIARHNAKSQPAESSRF
jgi:predicted alpha/beta-fold hydrolase